MSINELWVFLSGGVVSIGSAYVWLRTTKSKIKKDVSDNEKTIKINQVDGNKAIVEQLDYLLNQISLLYESALKDKIELSKRKNQEIRYLEREKRLIDIIKSCETCKITIEKLKEFNYE